MQDPEARKRWLALLEELGLPPDPEPTPVQAEPKPQESPAAVAEPIAEPPSASLATPTSEPVAEVPSEPAPEEAPVARTRRRRAPAASEPEQEVAPNATVEAIDAPEVAKEPAPRTRRRRRTTKAVVEAPEADADELTAAPTAGDELPPPALEEATVDIIIVENEEMKEAIAVVSLPDEVPGSEELPQRHRPALDEELAQGPTTSEEPGFAAGLEETTPTGSSEEIDQEPGEGDSPAREARRRRRRRRGKKPSDAPEGTATVRSMAAPSREDEEGEDEEISAADEALGEDVAVEISNEKPSAMDEEADEFEDLSNLNMPSWAELVGSLYRPPDR